jgi:hypothetical protein
MAALCRCGGHIQISNLYVSKRKECRDAALSHLVSKDNLEVYILDKNELLLCRYESTVRCETSFRLPRTLKMNLRLCLLVLNFGLRPNRIDVALDGCGFLIA